MISLAAPITAAASEGSWFVDKCDGKSCGPVGYFAVFLMFLVLCGGVFMLLQSNFGVLQGYLISATAFWMSWFVLALIWFTGVPNVRIDYIPGISREIPRSTPRFMGPQGTLPTWNTPTTADQAALEGNTDFVPALGTQKKGDIDAVKTAETAAAELMAQYYATELGVAKTAVTIPGTVLVDEKATQILRGGDSNVQYVRFTSKAATAGPTATAEEKALIAKVKPASFTLKLDKGTLGWPTYFSLPIMFVLFLGHLLGLMAYERKHKPVKAVARERERATAGV